MRWACRPICILAFLIPVREVNSPRNESVSTPRHLSHAETQKQVQVMESLQRSELLSLLRTDF
jgi:hypothetical protein